MSKTQLSIVEIIRGNEILNFNKFVDCLNSITCISSNFNKLKILKFNSKISEALVNYPIAELLQKDNTFVVEGSSSQNKANLNAVFLEDLIKSYPNLACV